VQCVVRARCGLKDARLFLTCFTEKELIASHTSVNWLGSRHQDLFSCQPAKETPFPRVGEIRDSHWHILLGFQHQSLKEGSVGVKLSSTILSRLVLPWHRQSEGFFLVYNKHSLTFLLGGNCCLW